MNKPTAVNEPEMFTPAELREMREEALIASFLREEEEMDHCESEQWFCEHAREHGLIGLED